MTLFRKPAAAQNDTRVHARGIDAAVRKFFQGGKFNFSFGAARGQLTRSGQATIGSGTTSVTVTHGAGTTPTLEQLHITLGNNPTNDIGSVWVDNIDGASFHINCESNPGSGGALFGWMFIPI